MTKYEYQVISEWTELKGKPIIGYRSIMINPYNPLAVKIAKRHAKMMKKNPEILRLEERVLVSQHCLLNL